MSNANAQHGPLSGRTVAVPETRELDRLASLLEADGATTLRCPLVAILDAPDPGPVNAWLRELVTRGFDDLIFLTGEGLRRLIARAHRNGNQEQVLAAMGRARKITRGPKPAGALHQVGLKSDLPASVPTSRGVMDSLAKLDLSGRRIGLQLYATDPNEALVRFLTGKGAIVQTVAPYIYASASDEDRVADLIGRMATGGIDVIAFTSASQVERLFAVAEARKIVGALQAGLSRAKVAAIGPIVSEALGEQGVTPDIVPEQPFVMKRMTAAIIAAFEPGACRQ